MEIFAIVLVVALVLTNFVWLWVIRDLNRMWQDTNTELLDRINVLANKPPMPRNTSKIKAGDKAPNEEKPTYLSDQLVDPEYEAVGRIDPGFIARARAEKNG